MYFVFLYEYVLKDISLGCVFSGLNVRNCRDSRKNACSSSCPFFEEFKPKLECFSVIQKMFIKLNLTKKRSAVSGCCMLTFALCG